MDVGDLNKSRSGVTAALQILVDLLPTWSCAKRLTMPLTKPPKEETARRAPQSEKVQGRGQAKEARAKPVGDCIQAEVLVLECALIKRALVEQDPERFEDSTVRFGPNQYEWLTTTLCD